eukprot:gene7688-7888_t
MVAVELLFWNHANTCDLISDEYTLKDAVLPQQQPRALAAKLNSKGEEQLKSFFEQLAADRGNMELLARQMTAVSGGRLGPKDISHELRRLGLKFGSLPPWLRPRLHQLWKQHREEGPAAAAAAIAGALAGGWSDKQVQKQLQKHNIGQDEAGGAGGGSGRSSTRCPVSFEQLRQLYEAHQAAGAEDGVAGLEGIAEHLPVPATSKQVLRWLDAAGAVDWLLAKLDAAEAVWQQVAAVGPSDYCLVPSSDQDLEFFCGDWSNELLVAAGVRNDSGDYFKEASRSLVLRGQTQPGGTMAELYGLSA